MNKLLPSLAAKITAIFLVLITVAIGVTSAVFTAFLFDIDAYVSQKEFKRAFFMHEMGQHFEEIEEYAEAVLQNNTIVADEYRERLSEKNSNMFFKVESANGVFEPISNYTDSWVYTDTLHTEYDVEAPEYIAESKSFETVEERWRYITECQSKYAQVEYDTGDVDTDGDGDYECTLDISYAVLHTEPVLVRAYVRENITDVDRWFAAAKQSEIMYKMRFLPVILIFVSAALFILSVVFLICSAGHKKGHDGITLNWIDRIPLDLYMFITVVCPLIMLFNIRLEPVDMPAIILPFTFIALSLVMTFSARAKAGAWWRNTVIYKLMHLIVVLIRAIPTIWGVLVCLGVLDSIEIIGMLLVAVPERVVVMWFLYKLLITPAVVYIAVCYSNLQRGCARIAGGDTDYKINTSYMPIPAFRKLGSDLNNISDGINIAVEERMKSERLKTELITNVSHDIKTPLTSIVNYTGLLRTVSDDKEKTEEYIGIIEHHSSRLRKLIDDLVEASKASTGNIKAQPDRIDINLLLSQSCGEYDERLRAAGIEPMLNFCDHPVHVMADATLLWRVFDNLFGNVCKYAMKGTRLYISAETEQDTAVLTFKNISGSPLNISGDELIERFVRGDASRSTEGSGLGLAISESLVKLQGGEFSIEVDGDLFKAVIRLKLC